MDRTGASPDVATLIRATRATLAGSGSPTAGSIHSPNLSIPSPCFGQTRLACGMGAEASSTSIQSAALLLTALD